MTCRLRHPPLCSLSFVNLRTLKSGHGRVGPRPSPGSSHRKLAWAALLAQIKSHWNLIITISSSNQIILKYSYSFSLTKYNSHKIKILVSAYLAFVLCQWRVVPWISTERFREEILFSKENVWLKFSVEFELSHTPSTILPACHLVELIVKLNNCLLKHFGMHRQRLTK